MFVYWNLHRHLWSARCTTTGRVILYADALTLRAATFRVSEAGRQRVLREGRKNVHAGVVGRIEAPVPAPTGVRVGYNPRKGPSFTRYATAAGRKAAVTSALCVHLRMQTAGVRVPTPVVLAEDPD